MLIYGVLEDSPQSPANQVFFRSVLFSSVWFTKSLPSSAEINRSPISRNQVLEHQGIFLPPLERLTGTRETSSVEVHLFGIMLPLFCMLRIKAWFSLETQAHTTPR